MDVTCSIARVPDHFISGVTLTVSDFRQSTSAGNYHYDTTGQFASNFCLVSDYDDSD